MHSQPDTRGAGMLAHIRQRFLQDMQHFLRTENRHLDATPLPLMMQVQGLVRVVEYLDAIRGKG